MTAKQLLPMMFGAGALVLLAVTGVRTGLESGSSQSYLAGSGHGVTATYTTPKAPAMLLGSTAGEEPAPVVTTTTTSGH